MATYKLSEITDPRLRRRVIEALGIPGPLEQAGEAGQQFWVGDPSERQSGTTARTGENPIGGCATASATRGAVRSNRIRQRTKPKSNKLETEFGDRLRALHPGSPLFEQAITFELANGLRYTPDWVQVIAGEWLCHEVKGKHVWDDSICKLKMAAAKFTNCHWFLQDKPDGIWREYHVLP